LKNYINLGAYDDNKTWYGKCGNLHCLGFFNPYKAKFLNESLDLWLHSASLEHSSPNPPLCYFLALGYLVFGDSGGSLESKHIFPINGDMDEEFPD